MKGLIYRMRSLCRVAWLGLLIGGFLLPTPGTGQTLEETLQQLSADAVRQYVAPITSAFGANLNGAWFHKAPEAKKMGFNLEIGLVAMGSFFPEGSSRFSTEGQFIFSVSEAQQLISHITNPVIRAELLTQLTTKPSQVIISGATITGSPNDYITIQFPGNTYPTSLGSVTLPSNEIQLPIAGFGDLAEVNMLPLVAPQVSIGTVMGSQLTFRFLPSVQLTPDLGSLKYFGFGIQHNPFVWFPKDPLPFNVAAGYYSQSLDIGTLFRTTTSAFGLNVSKQFGGRFFNLIPYAGFMLEKATMEVNYQYVVQTPTGDLTQDISLTLEGENTNRFILGLSLRLLLFNINVDYNIGKYNSITAGLNFAL
ncbi:MAG: hypothetical protein GXO78_08195 [Calditrichaeota bacterium]|nr:hypothetical protein [Calditrichota bacterium]